MRIMSVAIVLAAIGLVHCSSSSSSSSSTSGSSSGGSSGSSTTPTSTTVGAAGGKVASSDGNVDLDIPAGALASDTAITIAPTTSPAAGSVGTVYEFGPDGTTFQKPITIKFHYGSFDLGGHAEAELRVATFADGAWQAWPGTALDTSAKTVSAQATHFSPGAIITAGPTSTCSSFTIAASEDCGTNGCTTIPATCMPNHCQDRFPGSTTDSCTPNAMQGVDVTCCGITDGGTGPQDAGAQDAGFIDAGI